MKRQYKDYPHDIDYTKVRSINLDGILWGIAAIVVAAGIVIVGVVLK